MTETKKPTNDQAKTTTNEELSELSAEELESVAGGFNPQPDPPRTSFSVSTQVEYEKLVPAVNVLINTNVEKI